MRMYHLAIETMLRAFSMVQTYPIYKADTRCLQGCCALTVGMIRIDYRNDTLCL